MSISLFNELRQSAAYHSSIMTTYSVDPAFYVSIQQRLRAYGCENNILMADASMLTQSLNAAPEHFKNAGGSYAIVPIGVKGCFHPKIHLRLGKDRARLILGSANATAAGWGYNQEIATILDWDKSNELTSATAPLIRKAYNYLESWLASVPGDSIAFKRNFHRHYSPWLSDLEPNKDAVTLPDGSIMDIFFERGDGKESMMSRIARLTDGEKPEKLVLISPYWDGNLKGLLELQSVAGHCPVTVILNPDKSCFPIDALNRIKDIEFVSITNSDKAKFLHAKLILVETADYDHVIFGSANCTDDALGTRVISARNAETSIYRRLAKGSVCQALSLDLSNNIQLSDIQPQRSNLPILNNEHRTIQGGYASLNNNILTWWPPEGVDVANAEILAGSAKYNIVPYGKDCYRVMLAERPALPFIIRVKLNKGITNPIIVHDETALRSASPGLIDQRLQKALERVWSGEDDIIDLAWKAHLIFSQDKKNAPYTASTTGKKANANEYENSMQQDYSTPEKFRQAITLPTATGISHRFAVEDPGLIEILRIILRNTADIGGKEAEKEKNKKEESLLNDIEEEENEEYFEANSSNHTPLPVAEVPLKYSAQEIKSRRSYLFKALTAFEKLINHSLSEPKNFSSSFAIQTAFALNLMLYACTKEHKTEDGKSVYLMKFSPASQGKTDNSFALKAARLLHRIWVGYKGDCIVTDKFDSEFNANSDDVFYMIVISRWAMLRAFYAVADTKNTNLTEHFGKLAVKIYKATSLLGAIDPGREEDIIFKLDQNLGATEMESRSLIANSRIFTNADQNQPS